MNAPIQIQPDRTTFIGGSDVAAILGISPWKSPVDLWLDKTTPRPEDGQNMAAKRRGSRLEPYIRDMITEEYGLKIVRVNQRYVDAEFPFLGCEIDAETETENIEIKTVHPFKAKEWGEHETDQLPLHYIAQAQHGLGITGKTVCRFFALIGDDLKPYFVERDDETIEAMRSRCIAFWHNHVLTGIPPELDYDHKDVLETLARMYPGTDGTIIDALPDHEHWRTVYETAAKMADRYEGVVRGAKAHLLEEMGPAAAIRFDDGMAFTRKLVSKKAYKVEHAASQYVDFRFAKFKDQ